MLRLLRIEWMKVKNYRTFWILLAITVISMPGFNYMFYDLSNNSFPKRNGKSILGSPFAFPDVWQTVTWQSGFLFIIPAILIITLMSNEFTFKTHRQNIIDGWSRGQFIRVKLVEILLLSILVTVVVGLTVLGFGFWGNAKPSDVSVWQGSRFLFFFFVEMMSYSTIALLMAVLIGKAGLAMGVYFIYWIAENVIVGIFGNRYKKEFVDYLPQEVTDRLIPQPYLKAIITQGPPGRWEHHLPIYLGVAALYLIIYCVIVGRRFTTGDL